MTKEHNQSISDWLKEWDRCRDTIQNFDKLLATLRLQGSAVFFTFLGAAAVVYQLKFPVASCIMAFGATFFITVIWLLDSRISYYMLAAVERAIELEDRFAEGRSVTRRISEIYLQLPKVQQMLVPLLYSCLIICGIAASLFLLALQYGKIWAAIAGVPIAVFFFLWFRKSLRLYYLSELLAKRKKKEHKT